MNQRPSCLSEVNILLVANDKYVMLYNKVFSHVTAYEIFKYHPKWCINPPNKTDCEYKKLTHKHGLLKNL